MSRKPVKTRRSFEIVGAKSNDETEKNEVSEKLPKENVKPESATTLETGTSRTTFQIESIPENETTKKSSPKKEETRRSFLSPQKRDAHPEVPKKPIYERPKRKSLIQEKPRSPEKKEIKTYRVEPLSRELSREYPKSREISQEREYPKSREPSLEYPISRENSPERQFRREPLERGKRHEAKNRHPRERSKEREMRSYKHHPRERRYKNHDSSQERDPKRHKRGHFERSDDDYDRYKRDSRSRSEDREYSKKRKSREKSPKKKSRKRPSYEATSEEEVCCCCQEDGKKVVFCVPSDDQKRRYCCFVEAEPKKEKHRSMNPNLPSFSKSGFKRGPKNDDLSDIFCKNDPFPLQELCEQKRKTRRVPPGFSCPEQYSKSRKRADEKCEKEDEDKLFLLSMLPTLEKLNEPVKMDAKIQIMQIMQRYVYSKTKF